MIGLDFIELQNKVTIKKSNIFVVFLQFYVAISHFFASLNAPVDIVPFGKNNRYNNKSLNELLIDFIANFEIILSDESSVSIGTYNGDN